MTMAMQSEKERSDQTNFDEYALRETRIKKHEEIKLITKTGTVF